MRNEELGIGNWEGVGMFNEDKSGQMRPKRTGWLDGMQGFGSFRQ
jgi:hypothetical protein